MVYDSTTRHDRTKIVPSSPDVAALSAGLRVFTTGTTGLLQVFAFTVKWDRAIGVGVPTVWIHFLVAKPWFTTARQDSTGLDRTQIVLS